MNIIEEKNYTLFTKESLIELADSKIKNTFISIDGNVYDVTLFVEEVNFLNYYLIEQKNTTKYIFKIASRRRKCIEKISN
jgi:hypothetical protein